MEIDSFTDKKAYFTQNYKYIFVALAVETLNYLYIYLAYKRWGNKNSDTYYVFSMYGMPIFWVDV